MVTFVWDLKYVGYDMEYVWPGFGLLGAIVFFVLVGDKLSMYTPSKSSYAMVD